MGTGDILLGGGGGGLPCDGLASRPGARVILLGIPHAKETGII